MLTARIERAKQLMRQQGYDAMIATSYESVIYLTGFDSALQAIARDTQLYVVLVEYDSAPWFIMPVADLPSAHEAGISMERTIPYGGFLFFYANAEDDVAAIWHARERAQSSALSALQALLGGPLAKSVHIGVEKNCITHDVWHHIETALPNVKLSPCDEAIMGMRAIKDADEIERLKRASAITETALSAVLNELKPGMSEFDAVKIYRQEVIKLGGENTFAVITFGLRAAFVDTAASAINKLATDDMIRFDLGCRFMGYHADMARTAVMGKASNKLINAYNAVLAGERKSIEAVREGAAFSELFSLAVTYTQSGGLPHYNRHHCGHSIGLKPSEAPAVSASDRTIAKAGMVICLETPYYELGWGGVQVEDTMVIMKNGCELLTTSPSGLIKL